jgi:hypothetical protein
MEKETKDLTALAIDASKLVIVNDETYQVAVSKLKELKEIKKKFDAHYLPMKKKTYEAYKIVQGHIKEYEEPIKKAENIIKKGMSDYTTKKENERIEQEEKLRQEAEKIRLEAEAKEKKRVAEELKKAGMKKKDIKNEVEKVEVLAHEIVMEEPTKTAGVSYREIVKYEIIDFSKLPDEYKQENSGKINAAVKANIEIPGIRIYSEKITVLR